MEKGIKGVNMSKVKKSITGFLFLLLTTLSFFMVGCKNATPVEDIYFNLNEDEQIVLFVGQSLNMQDYVVVKPAYATNKKYWLASYDLEIVAIEGNSLKALKAGNAKIKVVSDDNPLKESLMTVIVKDTKTTLTAPNNLKYNEDTQSLSFDYVTYASSYTLKITGATINEEINVGNNNSVNLSELNISPFDDLIIVQVKANAPAYTYALETSAYSKELKFYQSAVAENVKVEGGKLTFNKSNSKAKSNIYINEELLEQNTDKTTIDLTGLDAKYAGQNVQLKVEVIVDDETKQLHGNDVKYFNSNKKSVMVNVLDNPNIGISSNSLTWQNVANSSGYSIKIDNAQSFTTENNYFDLTTLNNYETLISDDQVHKIKINPVVGVTSKNVAKTNLIGSIQVKGLGLANVMCSGSNLVWNQVENASTYLISLSGNSVDLCAATKETTFSMKNYLAGNFTLNIQSIAGDEPIEIEGEDVYMLSSVTKKFDFKKHETINANISNYKLIFANLNDDQCEVTFDTEIMDETFSTEAINKIVVDKNKPVDMLKEGYVFTAGTHVIKFKRLSTSTEIESDESQYSFVQLEQISKISVNNSVASVVLGSTNQKVSSDVTIKLFITKNTMVEAEKKTIEFVGTSYAFNTTNILDNDSYLNAGEYTISAYVLGDGSKTFSYRVNGETQSVSATETINVLPIPTMESFDKSTAQLTIAENLNASKYAIYKNNTTANPDQSNATRIYTAVLGSGESENYYLQLIGNGTNSGGAAVYLDSAISNAISVAKLKTPKLTFNNTTNLLTASHENAEGFKEFEFKKDNEIEEHDFTNPYSVATNVDSVGYKLSAIADDVDGIYYINSNVYSLTLTKISNETTFALNGLENSLTIKPTNHTEEYDLLVTFNCDGEIKVLTTQNGVLTDGETSLNYVYDSTRKEYKVTLINTLDHKAFVTEMNDGFIVNVKYIKPSTGEDILINSDVSENSEELMFNHINSTTDITINSNNRVVLVPTGHTQEHSLVVTINNGTDLVFTSNGQGKLVCGDIELPYSYDSANKRYYVEVTADHNLLIDDIYPTFTMKVKYGFNHNGIESDLDSVESEVATLNMTKISNSTTISVEDNQIVLSPQGHTEEYALYVVINNGTNLEFHSNEEGKLVCGNIELPYSYNATTKSYVITIVQNHNTLISDIYPSFDIKVQYRFKHNNVASDLDSSTTDFITLYLTNIDNATTFALNSSNQIVVTATNHTQQYALNVVINNGTNLEFTSNGEGKLVCGDVELPYVYNSNNYTITIFNSEFESLIGELCSTIKIKVKYAHKHGEESDLDSFVTDEHSFNVQPKTSVERVGQTLKFSSVETGVYLTNDATYSLLVNNQKVAIDSTTVSEGNLIVDIAYIYENATGIKEVNTIELLIETDVDNQKLLRKSNAVDVAKTNAISLNISKDNTNNDNSSVVSFAVPKESYLKTCVVEITDSTQTQREEYEIEIGEGENTYLYKLDNIDLESGNVSIKLQIKTTGKNGDVEMFDSNSSTLTFEKLAKATGFTVSNNVLSFANNTNAVGYEIYVYNESSYTKLNTGLVTATGGTVNYELPASYNGSTFAENYTNLAVKTISKTGNFSNSDYSDLIAVVRTKNSSISVDQGKFKFNIPFNILKMLTDQSYKDVITIEPIVTNGETKVDITKDLDSKDYQISLTSITVNPTVLLTYGFDPETLTKEKLDLYIKITQKSAVSETVGGQTMSVWYLNSQNTEAEVYGLKAPTKIEKVNTQDNNAIEYISWSPSNKNVLNGTTVPAKYIFKINYNGKDYYSNDSLLKYYDAETGQYKSYGEYIDATSVLFPYGYGKDIEDQEFVKFDAGLYKITVQAIPKEGLTGFNLCSSNFSTEYEFQIMNKVALKVEEGIVKWDALIKATNYEVYVYSHEAQLVSGEVVEIEELIAEFDRTECSFDFTNLDIEPGVYKVLVKATTNDKNTLNSALSDPIYVYRLPKAESVRIEDGSLVLETNQFFSKAIIEFYDADARETSKTEIVNNKLEDNIKNLDIIGFRKFMGHETIKQTKKQVINLNSKDFELLEGRNYSINVTLIGNTSNNLGFVNSKVTSISSLTSKALKTTVVEIREGVVKFGMHDDYVEKYETKSVYENFNYVFNTPATENFWNNTGVYKINIAHNGTVISIYAVDYYSFLNALNDEDVVMPEYTIYEDGDADDRYAVVNYNGLIFNVYENNIINLKDNSTLKYYKITEQMNSECENTLTMVDEVQEIVLTDGGSFVVTVGLLGGDSFEYEDGQGVTRNVGWLSAKAVTSQPFFRYALNTLSTDNGKIKFESLLQYDNEKLVDSPIYKIVAEKTIGSETNPYVFYIYHVHSGESAATALTNAKYVVQSQGVEDWENQNYIQAETKSGSTYVWFDISKYIPQGSYNITIKTLVGYLAKGEKYNYMLHSNTSLNKTFQKLTDVEFSANNGILTFNQSYVGELNKEYADNYEIVLYDVANNKEIIYVVNTNNKNLTLDEQTRVIKYVLPNEIDLGGNKIVFNGGNNYTIKIKAITTNDNVLNGWYAKDGEIDKELLFKKAYGVSNLKVENGIIKWNVDNTENYKNSKIVVSYLDETGNTKTIEIDPIITDVDESGAYFYKLASKDNKIKHGETYAITVYTLGGTQESGTPILNGNVSSISDVTRLASVDSTSIKTVDGKLEWTGVPDAVYYTIEFTYNNITSRTTTDNNQTSIDLSLIEGFNLDARTYTVSIIANGFDKLNSINSTPVEGFKQLETVSNIRIEGSSLWWDPVEGADKYRLDIYNASKVLKHTTETTTNLYSESLNVAGKYYVVVTALSVGEGKEFNAKSSEMFEGSTNAPASVASFNYLDTQYQFEIKTNTDMVAGDNLIVSYNLTYRDVNETVYSEKQFSETIVCRQGVYTYYLPVRMVGTYTNISVKVVRAGTLPSNILQCSTSEVVFDLFEYGDGGKDYPYAIKNSDQLLNIAKFSSENYQLISNVDLSTVTANVNNGECFLICDTFSGTLDGQSSYSLTLGEQINVRNAVKFALFGTLSNATVKNLIISELTLVNTFAKSASNVVNSLIATGANNSTLENITVESFTIKLVEQSANLINYDVKVSGLVGETTGTSKTTIIKDCTIKFAFEASCQCGYVGGVVAIANNTTIESIEVVITANNIKTSYFGGIVAEADNVKITNCETTGEYLITNINATVYIGGIVGSASSTIIENSVPGVDMAKVTVSNSEFVYIGQFAGSLLTGDSQIINCYVDKEVKKLTIFSPSFEIGICGSVHTDATIDVVVKGN